MWKKPRTTNWKKFNVHFFNVIRKILSAHEVRQSKNNMVKPNSRVEKDTRRTHYWIIKSKGQGDWGAYFESSINLKNKLREIQRKAEGGSAEKLESILDFNRLIKLQRLVKIRQMPGSLKSDLYFSFGAILHVQ